MPELSRFFGIIIRMYMEAGGPHHLAHFHAYYQNAVGIFSISPVELIGGALPNGQTRLVQARPELHQDELNADWELLQAGQNGVEVRPLLVRCFAPPR